MTWVNALRGAVLLGLAVFMTVGGASIVVVYAVAFALGVAETLFDSASEGIMPAVVPTRQLGDANGRLSTAVPAGAALGGVLATVAGIRSVYWASAAIMVVTLVLVLRQIWPTSLKRAIADSSTEGTD